MDYVREELLRQKRTLEVLMGGRAEEEQEKREKPQAEPLPESGETADRRLRRTAADESSYREGPANMGTVRGARLARLNAEPSVEETVWVRSGVPVSVDGAEERVRSDVRLMSRAIQRDARRYDGGFTMY